MITNSLQSAIESWRQGVEFIMFHGDCFELLQEIPSNSIGFILSSPPYFMGKTYDYSYSIDDFSKDHKTIAPLIVKSLMKNRSICWQTGYHAQHGTVFPLDFAVHEVFSAIKKLSLRNRIIWHFGHGAHCQRRFSGRHETVLWYTKGEDYHFDLDSVRVAQKYPGKRHYKGPNQGKLSGNPHGKNPSDVWAIPNVKAAHVEKTGHPCQFPVALAQRLTKALTKSGETVLDPFAGSGSTGIAAILEGRSFIGADISLEFCEIANERYERLKEGKLRIRPLDRPIRTPKENEAVSRRPDHFRQFA